MHNRMGKGQRGVNLDRVVRQALHKVTAVNLNDDKKHVGEQKEWCPRQREQQVRRLGGLEDGCIELLLIMMPLSNNVFLFIVFIQAIVSSPNTVVIHKFAHQVCLFLCISFPSPHS